MRALNPNRDENQELMYWGGEGKTPDIVVSFGRVERIGSNVWLVAHNQTQSALTESTVGW